MSTSSSELREVVVHDIETIEYDGSFWKRKPDLSGPGVRFGSIVTCRTGGRINA